MANSIDELKKELLNELKNAINEVAKKAKEDMKEGTDYFYAGGTPLVYQRTGALGRTPEVTSVSVSGDTVSLKAYLDKSHTYTTGDCPSMQQVLDLANYGTAWEKRVEPTVGNSGFWERAENNIEKDFECILQKHFH